MCESGSSHLLYPLTHLNTGVYLHSEVSPEMTQLFLAQAGPALHTSWVMTYLRVV